jgi:hypothetical protein
LLIPLATAICFTVPASTSAATELRGSCNLRGELSFERPLTTFPAQMTYRDRLAGTCSGNLGGVRQVRAPVVLEGRGSGALGCLAVRTRGVLRLTFTRGTPAASDDTSLSFFTQTVGAVGQFANALRGAMSGRAASFGTLLPSLGARTLSSCQAGTLTSARYDLVALTLTPLRG